MDGKHAPRGALARELLEDLIGRGMTIREIAAEVDRSPTTVRHWLARYGLKTLQRRPGPRRTGIVRLCGRHGAVEFAANGSDGQVRCPRCRSEQVSERRRRVKAILVAEAGGACRLCGYNRYQGALHFHHVDPGSKRFQVSLAGTTQSIERLRAEARKCVLLCSNCHAEVEGGVAALL